MSKEAVISFCRAWFHDWVGLLAKVSRIQDVSNPIFFYLDAHWQDNWPLLSELKIIGGESWWNWLSRLVDERVEKFRIHHRDRRFPDARPKFHVRQLPRSSQQYWLYCRRSQGTGPQRPCVLTHQTDLPGNRMRASFTIHTIQMDWKLQFLMRQDRPTFTWDTQNTLVMAICFRVESLLAGPNITSGVLFILSSHFDQERRFVDDFANWFIRKNFAQQDPENGSSKWIRWRVQGSSTRTIRFTSEMCDVLTVKTIFESDSCNCLLVHMQMLSNHAFHEFTIRSWYLLRQTNPHGCDQTLPAASDESALYNSAHTLLWSQKRRSRCACSAKKTVKFCNCSRVTMICEIVQCTKIFDDVHDWIWGCKTEPHVVIFKPVCDGRVPEAMFTIEKCTAVADRIVPGLLDQGLCVPSALKNQSVMFKPTLVDVLFEADPLARSENGWFDQTCRSGSQEQ